MIGGITAMQALATNGNGVSRAAEEVRNRAADVVRAFEQSQALFGAKAEAIARLREFATGEEGADPLALHIAEQFVRVLPDGTIMPEFAVDPDGAISLDWIESRHQVFSVSVGANSRLAYAWLDGTDKGHGVARFDGKQAPALVIEGINSITTKWNASLRAA